MKRMDGMVVTSSVAPELLYSERIGQSLAERNGGSMDYIDNKELWDCMNAIVKSSAKHICATSSVSNPTTVQRAALDKVWQDEQTAHLQNLQRYVGRYIKCKARVDDVNDALIQTSVVGARLIYLMADYSSETEFRDRSVACNYGDAFKSKAMALKRGDSIDLEGRVVSVSSSSLVIDLVSFEKAACFVATACYGDYEAVEVIVLRRYRDDTLLRTSGGTLLVSVYYLIAPSIARLLARSDLLKRAVRQTVLKPIVTRLAAKELRADV